MIEEMKIKKTYYSAIALALVSCSTMDEMQPEGMFMTSQQVNDAVTAIPDRAEADLAGIYSFAGQAHSTFTTNGSIHNDFGYPSVCMFQDCNGPDMVCDNSNYNWMSVSHNYTDRNDDYIVCYIRYSYFYNQIALCNSVLSDMSGINLDEASSELRHNAGQALAVRAFDYLGLAPYYSFRYQDNPDALSVNLMTEDTKDYYNNPRVTLREVYELIISDLDRAIDYLSDYNRGGDKSRVDQNVAYGLRVNGIRDKAFIRHRVEEALRGSALWEEVKDKLTESAFALSGGQQQRLCIARAMAVSPSVLLMDEPASALDPISTAKIEELICELKKQVTIVIVTHNMQQASRVSDKTAFFYMGEMIEYDDTKKIFTNPGKEATQNYITGRFG